MVRSHAAALNRNCSSLWYRIVEKKITVAMIVLKQVHRSSELQDNRILNNAVSIDHSWMSNIYLWVIRTEMASVPRVGNHKKIMKVASLIKKKSK
jgi:hypothetical protein